MTLDTYGHVFDELDGAERLPAKIELRRARDEAAAFEFLTDRSLRFGEERSNCSIAKALHRTRTGDPLLTIDTRVSLEGSGGRHFRVFRASGSATRPEIEADTAQVGPSQVAPLGEPADRVWWWRAECRRRWL